MNLGIQDMGRYNLMLNKLVNKYSIFLRDNAHMTTPICRKILNLAPPPAKMPSYAPGGKAEQGIRESATRNT